MKPIPFKEAIQEEKSIIIDIERILTLDNLDIATYSACVKANCARHDNCRRYLLYVYMTKNNIVGHTCIMPEDKDTENCNSFIPLSE